MSFIISQRYSEYHEFYSHVGGSDGVIILSDFMTLPVGWSLGISLIASFDEWQLLQLSDFMKFTNFIISWVEDAGGGGGGERVRLEVKLLHQFYRFLLFYKWLEDMTHII